MTQKAKNVIAYICFGLSFLLLLTVLFNLGLKAIFWHAFNNPSVSVYDFRKFPEWGYFKFNDQKEGFKGRYVYGTAGFDPYGYYYLTFNGNDVNSLNDIISESKSNNEIIHDSIDKHYEYPRAPKWWPPKDKILERVRQFSWDLGAEQAEGSAWFDRQENRFYIYISWAHY